MAFPCQKRYHKNPNKIKKHEQSSVRNSLLFQNEIMKNKTFLRFLQFNFTN